MAASKPAKTVDTRTRLIEEAERLFALRGFDGVSLREIGTAAGARNNSAAQYHFGDRRGLVDAVFDHRMAAINSRRLTLLAACSAVDGQAGPASRWAQVRALVAAMVVPLAETYDPRPHSTYYARFSSQVMADPALARSLASLERPVMAGLREVNLRLRAVLAEPATSHRLGVELPGVELPGVDRFGVDQMSTDQVSTDPTSTESRSGTPRTARVRRADRPAGGSQSSGRGEVADGAPDASTERSDQLLPHPELPHPLVTQRLALAATLFVRALADREADRDAGTPSHLGPFPAFVDGLVDAITGLLLAPVGPVPQSTREARP